MPSCLSPPESCVACVRRMQAADRGWMSDCAWMFALEALTVCGHPACLASGKKRWLGHIPRLATRREGSCVLRRPVYCFLSSQTRSLSCFGTGRECSGHARSIGRSPDGFWPPDPRKMTLPDARDAAKTTQPSAPDDTRTARSCAASLIQLCSHAVGRDIAYVTSAWGKEEGGEELILGICG